MKTRGLFKKLGTRTIDGRVMTIAEHKLMAYFRIGTTNIPAASMTEAIEKYEHYLERQRQCTTPAK